MTEDDWSLEGKEVRKPSAPFDDLRRWDIGVRVYYLEDIETLRQKLIEDFKEHLSDECEEFPHSHSFNLAMKTINKRFGVEE